MKTYNEKYFDMLVEFGKVVKSAIPVTTPLVKEVPDKSGEVIAKYKEVRDYVAMVSKRGKAIAFEREIKKARLSEAETQLIYYFVYTYFNERESPRTNVLVELIAKINGLSRLAVLKMLEESSGLFTAGFLMKGMSYPRHFILSGEFSAILIQGKSPDQKKISAFAADLLKPESIRRHISEYIVGQDEALNTISAAMYKHLLTAKLNKDRNKNEKIKKSNILIIGPTGVGKTYMAKIMAELLQVPFIRVNATQYTETGYVGMDVEEMIDRLYKVAGGNSGEARNGIIFIDEIDKIAAADASSGHNAVKDVSGLSVQQELLKLLEDDEVTYEKRTGFSREIKHFNIDNVLFIAGGAFCGIEDIIAERLKQKRRMGFSAEAEEKRKELLDQITHEDLEEYGFILEFLGRFGTIINMKKLSLNDFKNIITKAKNRPLLQYNAILKESGLDFQFSEKDVEEIASAAYKIGTGARSITNILEKKVNYMLSDFPVKDEDEEKE